MLQLALHILAGIVPHAFATPKRSRRTATWYSVIHRPKSHVSSCSLFSGVALYATLGGAWRSQAKYLVHGQLLAHGTSFLLTPDAQSWRWLQQLFGVKYCKWFIEH
jgi:hypothetical protein